MHHYQLKIYLASFTNLTVARQCWHVCCFCRNLSPILIVKVVWMFSALRMPTLWEQHSMTGKQRILLGRHEQSRFNLHLKRPVTTLFSLWKSCIVMCSHLAKWHSVAVVPIFVKHVVVEQTCWLSASFWENTCLPEALARDTERSPNHFLHFFECWS